MFPVKYKQQFPEKLGYDMRVISKIKFITNSCLIFNITKYFKYHYIIINQITFFVILKMNT